MSKTSKKEGEPMQGSKNRLRALILAICLLFSVAIGSVALAASDGWVADATGNEGSDSLTIVAAGASTDEAYVKDLLSSGLVADVYLMGPATKDEQYLTYTYKLEGAFAKLQSQLDACVKKTEGDGAAAASREAWEAFAKAAAELASFQAGTVQVVDGGSKVSNLVPGIYLVLPHGNGSSADEPAIAQSSVWEYQFDPIVIAIPSKDDVDGNGIIMTSVEDGDWLDDVTIYLKSSRTRRYGSVAITKTLPEETDGKKATFVFHITETAAAEGETEAESTGKNRPYDEYVSVYYDGTSCTTGFATKIPAGITVQITEVDAGPRYDLDPTVHTEVIEADDGTVDTAGVSVSFNNTPNGNNLDGYGIENKFEHDGETWNWQRVPAASSGDVTAE